MITTRNKWNCVWDLKEHGQANNLSGLYFYCPACLGGVAIAPELCYHRTNFWKLNSHHVIHMIGRGLIRQWLYQKGLSFLNVIKSLRLMFELITTRIKLHFWRYLWDWTWLISVSMGVEATVAFVQMEWVISDWQTTVHLQSSHIITCESSAYFELLWIIE